MWDILSWKNSALVGSEMLGLFVNTVTSHDKYSRCSMHNVGQQFQTPLYQNERSLDQFFIAFVKSSSNLQHSEKKMSFLGQVFPKLLAPK